MAASSVRPMTTWWGWAIRRARASTGLLLTLLVLVTATTAILAGTVGYSGAAATTAARASLTGAVPQEAGIRVQTRQAEDPQAQDAAARRLVDEAFSPAPVSVQRTVVSEPRPVGLGGTGLEGRLVVLGSASLTPQDASAQERVEIVVGNWPAPDAEPVQGMLHAAAAESWGVQVGDTLDVGGGVVEVVGMWRPVDADDAFWFGDPLVAAGRDGDDRGPLVVPPDGVVRVVEAPFVRWTVQPDASRIQPDDLAHLASAAASLRSSMKTPEVDVRGVTVDGDLAPTAGTAATNLATARALGVVPLSVLVLVTMLSVVQLARLLATTREPQHQLLLARGATGAQVMGSTVVESAVVALVGTALGGAAAWGVLQAVPAGDGQGSTVVRVALLTGTAVLAVLVAVAGLQVRRLTAGGRADVSGRTRAATALATVVLVLGAAAVAWWQLRRHGSPVVTREDGSLGTDLVAGAAPALLLAAAAVVAMALLGPVGRLVEVLTRPGRGATGHLAAAQVSRRLPVYAVPAVLTVLAVGATTLSGLYAGTSAQLRDDLRSVAQGAPVRAVLAEPPATVDPGVVAPPPPTLQGTPGVLRSAPVWVDDGARLGDAQVRLTVSPVADLAAVATRPQLAGTSTREAEPDGGGGGGGGGAIHPLVPVVALTTEGPTADGIPLPDGTTTLEATLDVELTVEEESLRTLQEGYEQDVQNYVDGAYGGGPLPEEDARSLARQVVDDQLRAAADDRRVTWTVSLTLLDPTSGTLDVVDGPPLTVQRPVVTPQEGRPYTEAEVEPGGGAGTLTFTLPEGSTQVLLDVRLEAPLTPQDRWDPVPAQVDARLSVTTGDGDHVLGPATDDWGAEQLAPPDVARAAQDDAERLAAEAQAEGRDLVETRVDAVTGDIWVFDDAAFVPASLDTSQSTWTLRGAGRRNWPEETVVVGPGRSYRPPPAEGPLAPPGTAGSTDAAVEPVPVALTPEAARAAELGVGDAALVEAFGTDVPVTVAALVPAVPGTLSPRAALLDRDGLVRALAVDDRGLPFPTELWAATAPGEETAVIEALAGRDDVVSAAGPASRAALVTDATGAARRVFWVASAGAVLLAATGIGAVAATLLGGRRPEVAVLRALGMPPAAQARSRALELGGVVAASVALGLGAGLLVARAVVPELARSTTAADQVALAAPLHLEVLPWASLMSVGAVAVAAVVLAQATRVRRQALDTGYREEIR